MNKRLIDLIGMDRYNDYVLFAYEYACQEAEFLELKGKCVSDRIYKIAFNNLCKHRRTIFLDEIHDAMEEIAILFGDDTAREVELEMLPYDQIPLLIKNRYEGR